VKASGKRVQRTKKADLVKPALAKRDSPKMSGERKTRMVRTTKDKRVAPTGKKEKKKADLVKPALAKRDSPKKSGERKTRMVRAIKDKRKAPTGRKKKKRPALSTIDPSPKKFLNLRKAPKKDKAIFAAMVACFIVLGFLVSSYTRS